MRCYKDNKLLVFETYRGDKFYVNCEPDYTGDIELSFYPFNSKRVHPEYIGSSGKEDLGELLVNPEVRFEVYCVDSDRDIEDFETSLNGRFYEVDIDELGVTEYVGLLNAKRADIILDTKLFQDNYGLRDKAVYGFLDKSQMQVKLGHLQEELNEILKAFSEGDLSEVSDGLLDLLYVGAGTLALMNMPVNALWNDIQIRNLNRKRRATEGDVGKRGSFFDVIKDANWTKPRTSEIIEASCPTKG